jgi:hypothetical protein
MAAELVEQQVAVAERNGRSLYGYTAGDGSFDLARSQVGVRGKPHSRRRAALRSRHRIYGDGSVIGSIQFRGAGPARTVSLPAGTLRVRGGAVCGSLQGMPFEPCFHIEKTDERSFRGSWMGFAYCDFTRRDGAAAG